MSRLGKKIRGTMTALVAATLTLGSAGAAAEAMGELRLLTWTKAQFPIQYEMAIVLAEAWSELGIESKIDPVNFPNPLIERVFNTHDFDAAVIAFTPQLQRLDPDFYTYNTFHSDRAVAGGWNFSGVMDPALDELLVAQRQEYDFEARADLVSQIQKQLYDANAWMPIVNADVLQVFNKTNFRDPVIPKVSGFNDVVAFFTLKPTGERDVVRWATEITDLKTINPVLASESSQVRLVYLIYDTLMRIGPEGEPQFWAATALDAVDDTTLDATIREGMTFHDGSPVTAEDVAFTFNYMKEHKAAYYNATLGQLESATATGPSTVRFELANPFAPFTTQTLAMVPIIPKHIWEGVEDPTTFENVPAIGSGTYEFGHWKKAQEFKVERFDGHFQPADNAGLLVIFYGTSEAAYTALVKQEADVLDSILPHQILEIEATDYLQFVSVPSNGSDTLVVNVRNAPYDDPALRMALSLATPRERMLNEFYEGYGNIAGSVIAPANAFWHDDTVQPYAYDIERARQVLADAGYTWDSDGRLQLPE